MSHHITVDFNEEGNLISYWAIRSDLHFAHLPDDEIKDKVAGITELAIVIEQITFD